MGNQYIYIIFPSLLLLPTPAFAQAAANLAFVEDLVFSVSGLVDQLVPLLIAMGLLLFIWGLVAFIAASGDEAAKEEGKRKMVWGIITLFVIVSVWNLVALLNQLTGVEQGATYVPVETGL